MEMERRGEQSISLSMSRIAEMTTSAVTNRVKGGQIKRGGKERTHGHNQLIRGWINYFKIGSMKTLCAKLDSNIRYRLRRCIWKHWKTPQNREKNLIKLGIDRNTARRVAYTGHRIAYVCNKGAVNVAINNKRLASFGLVSMLDYYTERCVTC